MWCDLALLAAKGHRRPTLLPPKNAIVHGRIETNNACNLLMAHSEPEWIDALIPELKLHSATSDPGGFHIRLGSLYLTCICLMLVSRLLDGDR